MKKLGMSRIVAAAGAAALTGTLLFAGAGTASADAPTAVTGPVTVVAPGEPGLKVTRHEVNGGNGDVTINHVSSWVTTYYDGVSWRANVRVDYGRSGAWTRCSDGSEHHGPLVGPGYWAFGGNCSGNGTITNYGWYDG